jgi:hypothetical protein
MRAHMYPPPRAGARAGAGRVRIQDAIRGIAHVNFFFHASCDHDARIEFSSTSMSTRNYSQVKMQAEGPPTKANGEEFCGECVSLYAQTLAGISFRNRHSTRQENQGPSAQVMSDADNDSDLVD